MGLLNGPYLNYISYKECINQLGKTSSMVFIKFENSITLFLKGLTYYYFGIKF